VPIANLVTWSISALAVLGVIVRPGNLPEALWVTLGAIALLLFSLISLPDAAAAVLKSSASPSLPAAARCWLDCSFPWP